MSTLPTQVPTRRSSNGRFTLVRERSYELIEAEPLKKKAASGAALYAWMAADSISLNRRLLAVHGPAIAVWTDTISRHDFNQPRWAQPAHARRYRLVWS